MVSDINLILSTYSQLFIKSLSYTIEDKLRKIVTSESKFNSLLQDKISSELYIFLTSKYSSNKDSKEILNNSINFLSNMK